MLVFSIDDISDDAILAAAKHLSNGKVSTIDDAIELLRGQFETVFVNNILVPAVKSGVAVNELQAYKNALEQAEKQHAKFSILAIQD